MMAVPMVFCKALSGTDGTAGVKRYSSAVSIVVMIQLTAGARFRSFRRGFLWCGCAAGIVGWFSPPPSWVRVVLSMFGRVANCAGPGQPGGW